MPKQEVFYEAVEGDRTITVLKTYDESFVRQVFDGMDDQAKAKLWTTLGIDESYDSSDIPEPANEEQRSDLLLDELISAGREDWRTFSYFVVVTNTSQGESYLYVSPDWPSAEAYAKYLATFSRSAAPLAEGLL